MRTTADILPPAAQSAVGTDVPTALTSRHASPPAERTGPAVCDVFIGVSQESLPAVVRLPCVLSVPVREETAPLQRPRTLLADVPTFREDVGPLPIKTELARQLGAIFAHDAARMHALEARRLALLAEKRLSLRAAARVGPTPATQLHVRGATRGAVSPPPRGRVRPRTSSPPAAAPRPTAPPLHRGMREAVRQHRRLKFRAPLPSVSLIPGFLWVGVGGLALGGMVLFLASVGGLAPVAGTVRATASDGVGALLQGLGALLLDDVQASTSRFAEAQARFLEAEQHLTASLTLVQELAVRLDPAGRLPRARSLLDAGKRVAVLGTRAANVVRLFKRSTRNLTETLAEAAPALRGLERDLVAATAVLDHLELSGLPPADAARAQALIDAMRSLRQGLATFLNSQHVVLELLGSRQDRQYLFLFQNNRELRPTGGFIGSFALVDVSQGEVRGVQADTIYNPDGQLKDFIVPPVPLQKITDRWFARDANWFADFRQSAEKVAHLFERSGGPTVDGVVAVTPSVLEALLRLTGPIPMPNYAVTVTADNVTAETQRLVTYEYDRSTNAPKAFIADLLPQVLARAVSLLQARWGELLSVFTDALDRKQILVFFRDAAAEEAIVNLGWGGALPELPAPAPGVLTDHLGRVEANVGGHKTDALIEQSVDYDVTVASDGEVITTLVVTRHHRGPKTGTPGLPPEEDPARKPNVVYERTLAPSGSTLLEARGFTPPAAVPAPFANAADYASFQRDTDLEALESAMAPSAGAVTVGRESGFASFGGWVVTAPEETAVTVLRYRLPFRLSRPSLAAALLRYELLLTHQPGHLPVLTRATLRTPEGFRLSWTGPASAVTAAGEQKATYAALIDRDAIWGAVIEEK